ncbi:hypothetical protein ACIOEX_02400 [Streptomyces sp. NPDC087850]|uniref:hypothetical protein n=1 Tax=Streptomyces sp. NPDC087850 TaxID=3365809 RepID=UPI00382B4006
MTTAPDPAQNPAAAEPPPCGFPGCKSPRAPHRGTGRPPKFCERPDHNRTTAFAERKRLEKLSAEQAPRDENQAPAYDYAHARIRDLLPAVAALAAQVRAHMDEVTGQLATLTDPNAAAEQVEHAHQETTRQLAEAAAARTTAETKREEEEARRVEAEEVTESALAQVDELSEALRAFALRRFRDRTTEREALAAERTRTEAAKEAAVKAQREAEQTVRTTQEEACREIKKTQSAANEMITAAETREAKSVQAAQRLTAEAEAAKIKIEGQVESLQTSNGRLTEELDAATRRMRELHDSQVQQLAEQRKAAKEEKVRYQQAITEADDRASKATKRASEAEDLHDTARKKAEEAHTRYQRAITEADDRASKATKRASEAEDLHDTARKKAEDLQQQLAALQQPAQTAKKSVAGKPGRRGKAVSDFPPVDQVDGQAPVFDV